MTHKSPQYKSFILRMWQESSAGEGWRIKISNLNGESEHYFADLDSLFAFIVSNTEDEGLPLTELTARDAASVDGR